MTPATRSTLDALRCSSHDDASGVWLHPACHLGAGTWARYENGTIRLSCVECTKLVVEIAVKGDENNQ